MKETLQRKVSELELPRWVMERLEKYWDCTLEEFILKTGWRDFIAAGIGKKGRAAIDQEMERLGIDPQVVLKGTIYELPSHLMYFFRSYGFLWIKDIHLDEIKLLEMMNYRYDNMLAMKHMLEHAGIVTEKPEGDMLIYDVKVSKRAQNALYNGGFRLLSSIPTITNEQIAQLRNVGSKTQAEIQQLRDHLNEQGIAAYMEEVAKRDNEKITSSSEDRHNSDT